MQCLGRKLWYAAYVPVFATGLLAVLIVLSMGRELAAQSTGSAMLYGTVTDTTGAVVAKVKVTATNVGTGATWSVATNEQGYYVIPELPIGSYTVRFDRQDFSSYVVTGVTLVVAQDTGVNAALKPGATVERVTVTAGAPLIDTQSSALAGTVEHQFIDQLPLIDRDIHTLEHIEPGTSTGFGGSLVVNGSRGGHNEYSLNGITVNDPIFTQLPSDPGFPNPDAVEEFTLVRNAYSAEYGRSEGGQVVTETRSGTNKFHGTLSEYLRNDKLDARPYFGGTNTPYKRNIFGGTVGGPVIKDKLFFFFSYQGERVRSSPNAGVQNIVPTQAERNGDFSALSTPIIDPTTGLPFQGNMIPQGRLDMMAQKILSAVVPLPNGPNGELIFAPPGLTNANQYLGKVDFTLTAKDRLSGTYYRNNNQNLVNQGLPNFFQAQTEHDQLLTFTETHTFNPNLLNTVTIGGLKYSYIQAPDIAGNLSLTLANFGATYYIPPGPQQFSVHVDGDMVIESGAPLIWPRQFLQLKDDLHWIKGNHSFVFGGSADVGRFWNKTGFLAAGRFTFLPTFTGNEFADFDLGTPTSFVQNAGALLPQLGQDYALYVQDTWKVRRDLTLNIGLRYVPSYFEKLLSGENSNFIPGEQSQLFPNAPAGLVYQGDPGVNQYYHDPYLGVFEPRFGFAWAPLGSPKWVVRSAFGVFHHPMLIFSADNNLAPPYGLSVGLNVPPSFENPYQGSVDPFPFQPVLPSSSAAQRAAVTYSLPVSGLGDYFSKNSTIPTTLQWNLTVQRLLTNQDGIEIAYAGSHSYHGQFASDPNPAVYVPGNSTVANENQRRPYYPNFGCCSIVNYPEAYSNYNGLQVEYHHRVGYGLTLLGSYTWSKTLSNGQDGDQFFGAIFDPFNFKANYGPASYDATHSVAVSYVWNLPWLAGRHGLAAALAKGWTASGIFTAVSGSPLTIVSGVDNSLTGYGNDHADLIGDPNLPGGRSRSQQINQWFNTSAFTVNALGTFGDTRPGVVRGPGALGWDMSFFRAFPIYENLKIEYRLDGSNIFNHVVLGAPNANVSSGAFGTIGSSGNPRILQMALRVIF